MGLVGPALTNMPAPSDQVREQIRDLGGASAAAAAVGRSARTLRRWAQERRVPSNAAGGAFGQAVEQRRQSEDFRRERLSSRRAARMRNNGAQFRFDGRCGPVNDSPGTSIKHRAIDWHLSGEAMAEILDAWVAEGDQAALGALGDALAQEYIGSSEYGWHFDDEARAMRFLRHEF